MSLLCCLWNNFCHCCSISQQLLGKSLMPTSVPHSSVVVQCFALPEELPLDTREKHWWQSLTTWLCRVAGQGGLLKTSMAVGVGFICLFNFLSGFLCWVAASSKI